MSTAGASKKRKHFDRGGGGGGKKNSWQKWKVINGRPKRGAPGVLLTCETGRERKCQREGIEILNHYYATSESGVAAAATSSGNDDDEEDNDEGDADADATNNNNTLSLEEELKLLKSKKGSPSELASAFGVYDTTCRGTVFVLCTLANCNLIPTIQTEYKLSNKKKKDDENNNNNNENNTTDDDVSNVVSESEKKKDTADTVNGAAADTDAGKRKPDEVAASAISTPSEDRKNANNDNDNDNDNDNNASTTTSLVVQEQSSSSSTSPPVVWDPISTVRAIMSDIDNDSNKAAPGSRFVTRMIPMQATFFASEEELQLTCMEVLKKYIAPSTKTFAIVFKRRHCHKLDRKTAIQIVGETMNKLFPKCKVELSSPQVTILVEVCGTLCGMSVVDNNIKDYRNFNLMGANPSLMNSKK